MHTFLEAAGQSLYNRCEPMTYVLSSVAIIILVALYYFRWRDFILPYVMNKRRSEESVKDKTDEDLPKLSVIFTINDQTELLRKHLPLILEQDYPNFEIIVVDEAPTAETKELLEQLQYKYRNLRSTFIPNTSTNTCKHKLAITLGLRSARSEWAVITSVAAAPVSKSWLRSLASCMDEECDVVLGYANYEDDGSAYAAQAIYERLWMQIRCLRSACGYGTIGGDEANFCIRKSAFINHNGYSNLLQIPFGESHLLIEDIATPDNVRIALGTESMVKEDLPLKALWKNQRICYREILHHATQRTHFYLWREGVASLLIYLYLLTVIAYTGFRVMQLVGGAGNEWFMFCIDAVTLLGTCLYFAVPVMMFHQTTRILGERTYGSKLIYNQLQQPFAHLSLKIKRWKLRNSFV